MSGWLGIQFIKGGNPYSGMICSICLRNTQHWNCLGRDYRFRQRSPGRESSERKSSEGHPPTAFSPLTSALSLGTLSSGNSEKPFVGCLALLSDPFPAKEHVCIFSIPLSVSYLTRFGGEAASHYCSELPPKSKRNERRQFML